MATPLGPEASARYAARLLEQISPQLDDAGLAALADEASQQALAEGLLLDRAAVLSRFRWKRHLEQIRQAVRAEPPMTRD